MKNAAHSLSLPMKTPTPEEIERIDREGFIVLPGLIDAPWRQALAARIDDLVASEGDRAGGEFHQEDGTDRLANLVDKGVLFDPLWTHPRVLGLVQHVLQRAFSLSSLNAREPKAGQGHQALHADWGEWSLGSPFQVVNSLWVLDDMDSGNGATRLVPGSHLLAGPIADPHPQQVVATLAAGDVLVMNAHCRHGGSNNRDGRRRRVIHSYYTAAENPQQCDFSKLISAATRARLSPAQQRCLRLVE